MLCSKPSAKPSRPCAGTSISCTTICQADGGQNYLNGYGFSRYSIFSAGADRAGHPHADRHLRLQARPAAAR